MRRSVHATVALLGALSANSCSSLPDACRGAECGASPQPDGGVDGGGVPVPEGCDPSLEPKDAPRCVVDGYGVFVDATNGRDDGAGTKAAPFKSLAAALAKRAGKPRVYVCEGTYPEAVTLSASVSLFGGFACGSWTSNGRKPSVAPSSPGYALRVDNVSATVTVADLAFASRDAAAPGESSVAVFVASSSVRLLRVDVTAGKGQDALDPQALADFSPATAPAGASGASGGAQTQNPLCNASVGGAAGNNSATSGASGLPAISPPFPNASFTGAGGTSGIDCGSGFGRNGSFGAGGTAGAGAATWGTLSADGWKPAAGTAGGAGGHGQGGGGGAQTLPNGTGGGGGPGGCGGAGGLGGGAGGSSIAILAFNSSLSLDSSSLAADNAGRGANAAQGQKAQAASPNTTSGTGADACPGGLGGHGGGGGGGGGGAGGLSVGLLYTGPAPSLDGASVPDADTRPAFSLGSPGAAGLKGLGAPALATNPASRPGSDGSDGKPGLAKAILSIP